MRLDHLLSREEVRVVLLLICEGKEKKKSKSEESGGDALRGHTRSHPEHEAHACVGLVKP